MARTKTNGLEGIDKLFSNMSQTLEAILETSKATLSILQGGDSPSPKGKATSKAPKAKAPTSKAPRIVEVTEKGLASWYSAKAPAVRTKVGIKWIGDADKRKLFSKKGQNASSADFAEAKRVLSK